jgi:hypothetical protein
MPDVPARSSPSADGFNVGWWARNRGLTVKAAVLGALALGALGFFAFWKFGDGQHPSGAATAAAAKPARPALTAEEENYIRALWPIHGDVERSSMRVTLGQIFYKNRELDAEELKARVEKALVAYGGAQARIQALQPPASLRAQHEEYAAAIRLFEESALEITKMFKDGREDHLLAAFPKGQAGADKIREVGGRFWPNEFAPH